MARAARASIASFEGIPSFASLRSSSAKPRPTLLWVDDFEPGLALYRAMFEALGFRVLTASSGQTALQILARNHVDLVVTDFEMPDMNGEGVALAVKSMSPQVPVLLFSGSTTLPPRVRRVVDGYCDKAGSRDKLLASVHNLLYQKRPHTLQPPPVSLASDHGHRTVA